MSVAMDSYGLISSSCFQASCWQHHKMQEQPSPTQHSRVQQGSQPLLCRKVAGGHGMARVEGGVHSPGVATMRSAQECNQAARGPVTTIRTDSGMAASALGLCREAVVEILRVWRRWRWRQHGVRPLCRRYPPACRMKAPATLDSVACLRLFMCSSVPTKPAQCERVRAYISPCKDAGVNTMGPRREGGCCRSRRTP